MRALLPPPGTSFTPRSLSAIGIQGNSSSAAIGLGSRSSLARCLADTQPLGWRC